MANPLKGKPCLIEKTGHLVEMAGEQVTDGFHGLGGILPLGANFNFSR
jgi:hypothetical protein